MKDSPQSQDQKFMRLALKLAEKGRGHVSPNPLVGCVVVKNQKILAKGFHKKFGGPHAEIEALKKLKMNAKGATLYVTLEPCHHFGKTPPCVDAVIRAGIKRVVIAMTDPNSKTCGKSIRKLKKNKLAVTVGVCETQAQVLNRGFVKFIQTGLPYVIVKIGQSADGKIALRPGLRTQITGKDSQKFVQNLRKTVDGILVGKGTIVVDNPLLTVRGLRAAQPKRLVLDSQLRISPQSKIFGAPGGDVVLCVSHAASKNKIKKFANHQAQILLCAKNRKGHLDLKSVLQSLVHKARVSSVLVEGGAKVFQSFAKNVSLVDEWHFLIAPQSLGKHGVSAFQRQPNLKGYKKSSSALGADFHISYEKKL